MDKSELLGLINAKVNELFYEYQMGNNIQYGDISPEDVMVLQEMEDQLADFIIDVSNGNI